MIHIRYCEKCEKAHEIEECPYCRKDELKKRKENGFHR